MSTQTSDYEQRVIIPAIERYFEENEQPLREIAGRLQHLSYRDLNKLSALIHNKLTPIDTTFKNADVAGALLSATDAILKEQS